jgi:hypothetical protein
MRKKEKTRSSEMEELIGRLIEVRNTEKELRSLISELEINEKIEESEKYLGRCFKEKSTFTNRKGEENSSVRCVYVYDIDNRYGTPMSLSVSYWESLEDQHFSIEYYDHFKFEDKDEESIFSWEEITKDEFMSYYSNAQKRISESLLKGK